LLTDHRIVEIKRITVHAMSNNILPTPPASSPKFGLFATLSVKLA